LKRENQELEKIIAALSPIESKWRDAYADQVIATLEALPEKEAYTREDLIALFERGFKPANTIMQLVLDFRKTSIARRFPESSAKREQGSSDTRKTKPSLLIH
jgi:hypothetical protein